MNQKQLLAKCQCGNVKFEAVGSPILVVSAIARVANKRDVNSNCGLPRRLCSTPTVEQALSYIERIECDA
jgi:hypothetical protein